MTKSKHWTELRDDSFKGLAAEQQERPRLAALTVNQGKYIKAIETSVVTICTGPAGTGKTYIACGIASQMLRAERISRIVLTRPLVQCGKGYGYRPGTRDEKVAPDMRPMLEAVEDFLGARQVERLRRDGAIELFPLDDMRGSNIRDSFVICDEAQNCEPEQLRMLLTRFARGSRVVVCGDASQTDLRRPGVNPLLDVINRFRPDCHPSVSIVRLHKEDIVRHELIQWIDERLSGPARPDGAYYPTDGGWLQVDCPDCKKTVFYEHWAQQDDMLVQCFHCRAFIELLDEQGRLNPITVTPEEDDAFYCSRDVKPSP